VTSAERAARPSSVASATKRRRAKARSTAPTFWLRRAARQCRRPRSDKAGVSMTGAASRSTPLLRHQATGSASMPSATSPAACSSPMSRATMPAWWFSRSCSACRQGEPRHHSLGDLHRSRAGPCRLERGRGGKAPSAARISILRWPYAENDRAQAERKTTGLSSWWLTARAASSALPSPAPAPAR
jgi:hypothetical protein